MLLVENHKYKNKFIRRTKFKAFDSNLIYMKVLKFLVVVGPQKNINTLVIVSAL